MLSCVRSAPSVHTTVCVDPTGIQTTVCVCVCVCMCARACVCVLLVLQVGVLLQVLQVGVVFWCYKLE